MEKKPLERDIQKQIIAYLRLKNVYCWENRSQGTFDPKRRLFRQNKGKFFIKGVSDVLGITTDGTFIAIEVKRPGGKVTPEQMDFIANIARNNGIAFVAYSLKDVQDHLIARLQR